MALLKSDLQHECLDSIQNPFHSEPFRSCWFTHLAAKFEPQAQYGDFLVHYKRVAKGLITLKELKFYAGTTGWYHDFTEAQAQSFLELQGKLEWDYFYGVWAESRQDLQAFEQLKKQGFPMIQGFTKPMHMVDLSQGYDHYLSTKSSNYRYQMRKKLKKAVPLNPKLVTYDRSEDIEPFFEQFFQHHIAYWTQKIGNSYYTDPREQAFTLAYYKALHQEGRLLLQALEFDGEPVNFSISFSEGPMLIWPLMINTGRYLDYTPGLISLYLRIQDAAARGYRLYNMGYGEFDYKTQAETHRDSRHVVVVVNPRSLKGHLMGAWFGYKNKKGIRFK